MSEERVEQLRKVALFAGLKPQALERIAKGATEEGHTTGTKIFQQHARTSSLIRGKVNQPEVRNKKPSRCSGLGSLEMAHWTNRRARRTPPTIAACRDPRRPHDLLFLHKDPPTGFGAHAGRPLTNTGQLVLVSERKFERAQRQWRLRARIMACAGLAAAGPALRGRPGISVLGAGKTVGHDAHQPSVGPHHAGTTSARADVGILPLIGAAIPNPARIRST